MDERKIIEKLVDRAPLAVIVIGVIVFIMGAAGGVASHLIVDINTIVR